MLKFKKVVMPFLAAGFVFSLGSNVFAAEVNDETPTINWEEVWNSVDLEGEPASVIDFGSKSTGGISTYSWGDLAKGSTKLSPPTSGKVKSTGKTTGKILTTTVSATTSLRISGMSYITGPKKIALGKLTATSEVSTKDSSGNQAYEGLTLHTATDSGVLYESETYDSNIY